jgi:hypothetical protein
MGLFRRSNTGLFTGRERAYLGRLPPPDVRMQERQADGPESNVQNSMRDDFAPRRGDNCLGGRVVVLQRATAASLGEIDDLIVELRRRREGLVSESARVQNEIVEFAQSNHSAIETTQIITQRLASFNGSLNAGRVRGSSAAPIQEFRSDIAPTRDAGESCPGEQTNGETAFHQGGGNEAA